MASRRLFNKSRELREMFSEVYDNPTVLPIFNNTAITSKTVSLISSQSEISFSIVVSSVSGTASVSIDVYPVDMFGNVLNSASLVSGVSLDAVGNVYGSFSAGRFRQFSVVITASGTLSGTVVLYG